MSIQCGQCGTVNPNEALFCKKCGGRLKEESSATVSHNSPTWEPTAASSGHSQTRWRVLDSSDPFPDKAAKYKVLNVLVFVAINIIFWFGGNTDFFQKLWAGFLLAAAAAWIVHLLICNIALGLISLPLNHYKYWLPREISAVDLARKIVAPMSEIDLRVELNSGFTGGILVGDDHITYQVTLDPYKGYFRVLSGKVTNYGTYDSIIRDTPRIAYAIQQILL